MFLNQLIAIPAMFALVAFGGLVARVFIFDRRGQINQSGLDFALLASGILGVVAFVVMLLLLKPS